MSANVMEANVMFVIFYTNGMLHVYLKQMTPIEHLRTVQVGMRP